MIYLYYKDTKTFGLSFSFLLIFKTLRASYLQVGNFSKVTHRDVVIALTVVVIVMLVLLTIIIVRSNRKLKDAQRILIRKNQEIRLEAQN